MSQSESKTDDGEYVDRKYLESNVVEDRPYQRELVNTSEQASTLVALPTGTGKTAIAVRLAARRLEQFTGKVLMLAPTQPLVNQHADFFKEALAIPDHEIKVFTGDIRPDERAEVWSQNTSVIIATPQVIENDLVGNRYSLDDVFYLVFDECHRATGDYAYNYIAERYHGNATHPLVTGLSASPGSSKDKILEVSENLGLTNIEVLTEDDELLKEYLPETQVSYEWIETPDQLIEARDLVQDVYSDKLKELKKNYNVINSAQKTMSVKKLMRARGKIQELIDNDDPRGYKAQSVHAEALKLNHGWRTIESQSPQAALSYFEQLLEEGRSNSGSKAAARIAESPRIEYAIKKLREYNDVHPKLKRLHSEVALTISQGGQALIFTESRETVERIVDYLEEVDKIHPVRFVGQSDKSTNSGMSQTEQAETLDAFRDGEYNVLVSTSVAEEGIDIPSVDLVLFYEPVPNAVRTIQRRGRTGREQRGRVVVLIAEDTEDESKYYISKRREENMHEELQTLKEMEEDIRANLQATQSTLEEYGERFTEADGTAVFIDSRETKSAIGKELDRMDNITVKLETLEVGDYIASERVAIERKELDDLLDTLVGDRDIFTQMEDLADNYERPILIVEGGNGIEDLYGRAQIGEEAIRSLVNSIAVDFGISILFTRDEKETAKNIRSIARREQEENDQKVNPHGSKSTKSMADQQVYIVSSIPEIGPVTAERLLDTFGSIRNIVNAPIDELTDVEGIGESLANQIIDVSTATYDPSQADNSDQT